MFHDKKHIRFLWARLIDDQSSKYFHIRFFPCWIKYIEKQENPRPPYWMPADESVTWFSTSVYDAEDVQKAFLSDLRLDFQGNKDQAEIKHLYAGDYAYRDVWTVDVDNAPLMAKTLRMIQRKLGSYESKFGRADGAPAFTKRFVQALDVKAVLTWDDDNDEWLFYEPENIDYLFYRLINRVREKYPQRVVENASS